MLPLYMDEGSIVVYRQTSDIRTNCLCNNGGGASTLLRRTHKISCHVAVAVVMLVNGAGAAVTGARTKICIRHKCHVCGFVEAQYTL
jgi:hypothetical protein